MARLRWPEGIQCTRCGHRQVWQTGRGLLRCGGCRKDIRVTAGTIFDGSKLSLRIWYRATWWITNQKSGVSALGLQRTLGLGSYETAWAMLHKLRRAMVRPGREQLTGKVEVDETMVGGRRRNKALVAMAAEVRGDWTGRIRLQRLPDDLGRTLRRFVRRNIAPGSTIVTDGRPGYRGLVRLGYAHAPTTLDGKGRTASLVVLPRVHRVAALLKRWLLGTHQGRVAQKSLDHYLDEFAFRFNRRSSASRGQLFFRVLEQAVAIKPTRYEGIVGHVD